jgi:hypothetical protein
MLLQIVKEWWTAACNKPSLHVAIYSLFTIVRYVSSTVLKISKKQLQEQLLINKQHPNNDKISQNIFLV